MVDIQLGIPGPWEDNALGENRTNDMEVKQQRQEETGRYGKN